MSPPHGGMLGNVRKMEHRDNNRVIVYSVIVLAGLFVFAVYALAGSHLWGLEYPVNSFLFLPEDRFMDFFHINALASGGRPYQDGSSYPPFALFCAMLISKLIPGSEALDPFSVRDADSRGMLVMNLLYFFCVAVIGSVLAVRFLRYQNAKSDLVKKDGNILKNKILPVTLLLGSVVFSAPMIYAYDRGNYLILCILFLFLFAFLYQKYPVLSALSLAVASALKIYPVILFLLFLLDRKWKPLFAGVFSGGIATFLTFFCFEGTLIENGKHFVWNLLNFTGGNPMTHVYYFRGAVGIRSLLAAPFLLFFQRIPEWLNISTAGVIAGIAVFVVVAVMCLREKRFERRILFLSLFMILFPAPSYYYNIIYLVAPVCLLLLKNEKLEWYIPVLTALMMIPKNYLYISPLFDDIHVTVSAGHFLDPLFMCILLALEFKRLFISIEKLPTEKRRLAV